MLARPDVAGPPGSRQDLQRFAPPYPNRGYRRRPPRIPPPASAHTRLAIRSHPAGKTPADDPASAPPDPHPTMLRELQMVGMLRMPDHTVKALMIDKLAQPFKPQPAAIQRGNLLQPIGRARNAQHRLGYRHERLHLMIISYSAIPASIASRNGHTRCISAPANTQAGPADARNAPTDAEQRTAHQQTAIRTPSGRDLQQFPNRLRSRRRAT